jgi:ribosomal protein S18 acetylase RimI-like enzyme
MGAEGRWLERSAGGSPTPDPSGWPAVGATLPPTCGLLEYLLASPLDHRLALGLLDPAYQEWRPEGRRECWVKPVGETALLTVDSLPFDYWDGDCHVLGPLGAGSEAEVAAAARELGENQITVLGEEAFRALAPHLPDGAWRLSRNYGLTPASFRPRSSAQARLLEPRDSRRVARALARNPGLRAARSTRRDLQHMLDGRPVTCYGAFDGDALVGFCSSNPICRGVTEISWLYVSESHRRRRIASALLEAQAESAFVRGEALGYHAGSGGEDLDAMLRALGFRELLGSYRFLPATSPQRWRSEYGRVAVA